MTFDKVQSADKFLDLSDYARPIARRLTRALVNTRITPIQITIAYTLIGLIAAILFATGTYLNGVIAGVLLLVKSTLDAVDGSLARARQRPSRVGRFLDSICDYFINAAVFFGLALNGGSITIEKVIIAFLALECATWQGTAFNYYYVYYRKLTGGDTTSQLNENEARTIRGIIRARCRRCWRFIRSSTAGRMRCWANSIERSRPIGLHRSIGISGCSPPSPRWASASNCC